MKRVLLLFIIICGAHSLIFSDDFVNDQLDKSIDEFSQKNYDSALEIINGVLIVEPDNSIALMYKKTIEDVISIDEDINEIIEEDLETPNKDTVPDTESILPPPQEEVEEIKKENILSFSTYIGKDLNNSLFFEERIKIILGAPIIEVQLESIAIDYGEELINFATIPFENIFNFENYNLDIGIGYRYKPFNKITEFGGYFDLKLGVTNFSNSIDLIVPYLGFDTETALLSSIGNNIIFNNLWVGGSGSIYSFNGVFINNIKIEGKIGINIGFIKIGAFYSYSNIESIIDGSFNNKVYGLIIGVTF